MSSDERKQIVGYLYRLIKESPLFTNYTDERIREAAVRAELKAYNSSSTKEEYLRAMNNKIERIKKAAMPEEKMGNYHTETCFSKPQYIKEDFRNAQQAENAHYKGGANLSMGHKQEYRPSQPIGRSQSPYGGIVGGSSNHYGVGKQGVNNNPHPSSSNLHNYNNNYQQTNSNLHTVNSNFHPTNSNLNSVSNNLHTTNNNLHTTNSNLHQTITNPHSNSNLHSIKNNLHPVNTNPHTNSGSLHNSTTSLHNMPLHSSSSSLHNGYINPPGSVHTLPLGGKPHSGSQGNALHNPTVGNYSYKSFGEDLYGYSQQPNTREYQGDVYNNDGGYSQYRREYHQERPTSLFSNFNLKESNYYQPMYNYDRTSPGFQQPLSNQYRQMRPEASSRNVHHQNISPGRNESYVFVNDISGTGQRMGEAKSFGHSSGGYITDRGFHSNKKLFEHPQSHFVPTKPMEFQAVPSSLKFRSRYEEPHKTNPISSFTGDPIPHSRRYPQTSPIGGTSQKKKERSFSSENPTVSFPGRQKEESKPGKRKIEIDESQANDLFNSIGTLFEQGEDPKKERVSGNVMFSESGVNGNVVYNRNITINENVVSNEKRDNRNLSSNEKRDNRNVVINDTLSPGIIKDQKNDHLYRSPKSASESRARDVNFSMGEVTKATSEDMPLPPKDKVILEESVDPKKEIPSHLKSFIVGSELNILETSQENVEMLKDSLSRCEETQAKALEIYQEHKKEFPNSKLHQSYTRTTELINKQREALHHSIFFLTWRCVDDLLDILKGTYIDMKVELDTTRKKVVNLPEAINKAFQAFSSSKKRDDDFVLDLRDN